MKKIKSSPKTEESIDILKKLAKRVEEAVIDIHETKRDLKFMKLKLISVEHNTQIMKVDVEKMVTQQEFKNISHRVDRLELVQKAI